MVLSERQLRQGDVSLSYVSRRMSRHFTSSHRFRRVLQTIWHQVSSSDQVLVVGVLQDDGTVRGGTGWGAELARIWNKSVAVYDQEKKSWFQWEVDTQQWVATGTPSLKAAHFCGTGTRKLSDDGRRAIEAVFEVSFGSA